MTLPSQAIRQLAEAIGKPKNIEGQAAQLARQGRVPVSSGYSGSVVPAALSGPAATPSQARFIRDMRTLAPALRVAEERYSHPADASRAAAMKMTSDGRRVPAQDGGLTDSDRTWLAMQPLDPATVPFKDAVDVLALQAQVRKPDDRRLVDAIAQPIRDHHDQAQADVELRNALAAPVPAMPPSALPALADAIRSEHPDLTASEALARASEIVDGIVGAAHTSRLLRIDAAEQRLDQLASDREARSATQPQGK